MICSRCLQPTDQLTSGLCNTCLSKSNSEQTRHRLRTLEARTKLAREILDGRRDDLIWPRTYGPPLEKSP